MFTCSMRAFATVSFQRRGSSSGWSFYQRITSPSSYRPICLLDTIRKVLERIVYNRMTTYSKGSNGLSSDRYGFRKERSTIDAIDCAVDKAIAGSRWKNGSKQYCVIVTLDVRNIFNSANWSSILYALELMAIAV